MSDLFGNHIVGFPTRRLISLNEAKTVKKCLIWDDFFFFFFFFFFIENDVGVPVSDNILTPIIF